MDPFIGEIRPFAGNYAPRDWAFCAGQLLQIAEYTALFSIITTTYGGDGMTNFALPDLRGRAVMHQGTGAGLTPRTINEITGTSTVTLIESEMPSHTHAPQARNIANQKVTEGNVWGSVSPFSPSIYSPTPNTSMNPQAISPTGGTQSHNNMQPYLGLNFIIALDGVYPSKP